MAHRPRAPVQRGRPVLVTLKLRAGLPPLRDEPTHEALRSAFVRGKDCFGFRLVHYAVRDDQLVLICEAADGESLRQGMQGLAVRIARTLNRFWRRKGKLFADRFRDRPLTTPQEVRDALVRVMGGPRPDAPRSADIAGIDPFSSAPWFDGFRDGASVPDAGDGERPVAEARTALLRNGWRRLGLLHAADA